MNCLRIKQTVQRLALLSLLFPFADLGAAGKPLVHVELVSQRSGVIPGSNNRLAILMTPQPGWHGYWEVPGDIGFPTTISWTLPKGVTVGETKYPVPETLLTDDIVNYVYPGQFALITPITVSQEALSDQKRTNGQVLSLNVKLNYLVCSHKGCVPESSTAELNVPVYSSESHITEDPRFNDWLQRLPRPVSSMATFEIDNEKLTLTLPLPDSVDLPSPYLFVKTEGAIDYNARQLFTRSHNELIIEATAAEGADLSELRAVLALGDGTGLAFTAKKESNSHENK